MRVLLQVPVCRKTDYKTADLYSSCHGGVKREVGASPTLHAVAAVDVFE